jgi:hypothetical protein
MAQIDADAAVKILVAAAPSATAEPAHKAMRFIEDAARRGRVQVRAFRGHATERGEVIPAVEVADLTFDCMARHAGKDGGILGEADLVTAGWGTLCRGLLWGVHQTVWRNVRFLRHEIEGARVDFLALLEGFSGVGLRSGAQNFLRPSRPPSHKIIRRRDFMLTKTFVRNRKDNYFTLLTPSELNTIATDGIRLAGHKASKVRWPIQWMKNRLRSNVHFSLLSLAHAFRCPALENS